MARGGDWTVRLVEWAEARLGKSFAWGQVDCVILCLEVYDLLAGSAGSAEVDGSAVAEAWRGRYASELEGVKLARDENTDLRACLEALGCTAVRPGYQQRGDLILVPNGLYWCGHVCFGTLSLSVRPESVVEWFYTAAIIAATEHGEAVILRVP